MSEQERPVLVDAQGRPIIRKVVVGFDPARLAAKKETRR